MPDTLLTYRPCMWRAKRLSAFQLFPAPSRLPPSATNPRSLFVWNYPTSFTAVVMDSTRSLSNSVVSSSSTNPLPSLYPDTPLLPPVTSNLSHLLPSPGTKKNFYPSESPAGVITLWSLETVTLLSTLLPPRTRDVRLSSSSSSSPLKSLGFIPGSGRVFAAGSGYAAVWDMVSPEVRGKGAWLGHYFFFA